MQRFLLSFAITTPTTSSSDHDQRGARLPAVGRTLWLLLLCSGLSCHSSVPTAPTFPADTDGYRTLALEEPPGLADDMPPKQTLLPGDLLLLRILSAEPHEPTEVWVNTEGRLHIPLGGDVRTARNVPFHEGLRLTEALAAAGGPTRTADTADVRIIRGPLSRAKVYRANLDDLIDGNTTDVVFAPGDVVFVSEHWFATATDILNRLTPLIAAAA